MRGQRLAPVYNYGRVARLEHKIELLRWYRWQLRYPQLLRTGVLRLGAGSHIVLAGNGRLEIGRDVVARPDLTISSRGLVQIGDGVFLGRNTNIACNMQVTIGHGTRFAERVSVHDANHVMEPISDLVGRRNEIVASPVSIGARAWLATNVVVVPGVSIGDDVVVAAGSVVTRDIPAGMLAAGVPARVVRALDVR